MSDTAITKQMYGGVLVFDPVAHVYTFNGDFVPGVTTPLNVLDKPALVGWAAGLASEHWHSAIKSGRTDYDEIRTEAKKVYDLNRDAAADIGTNVHAYAEAFFKKQPLPELRTDQAKRGVEAFHDWESKHKIEILGVERLVYSKEHHFAGTCDFIAKIDGRLVVGDIKTSSGIYNSHRFQVAAYQGALQEEKNMTFEERLIVRFDKKTGKFQTKSFFNFELDFKGFLSALSIYRIYQSIKDEKKGA